MARFFESWNCAQSLSSLNLIRDDMISSISDTLTTVSVRLFSAMVDVLSVDVQSKTCSDGVPYSSMTTFRVVPPCFSMNS